MTSIKKGDALGDCPECGAANGVIYRGNNEGVCKECGLVCEIELEDGEEVATAEEQPQQPDPQPVSQPEPQPAPAPVAQQEPETPAPYVPEPVTPEIPAGGMTQASTSFATPPVAETPEPAIGQSGAEHAPPKVVVDDGPGQLKEVVGAPIQARETLKLTQPAKKDTAKELKIPEYVQKSRPWRWAHEMDQTGNPYRSNSKSFEIFRMISHGSINVKQLVTYLYEQKPEVCDKLNILLTIYEVLTQCVAAGLLIMDEETGNFQVCQGAPQPHKMP